MLVGEPDDFVAGEGADIYLKKKLEQPAQQLLRYGAHRTPRHA
jgi:hypothetical protein